MSANCGWPRAWWIGPCATATTVRGGQYEYGQPTGEVVRDTKMWWNQAELLGALAFLYRLSGDPRGSTTLEHHLEFIERYVLDAEHRRLVSLAQRRRHVATGPHGRQDYKGSRWKSFYHVIQGLYHPPTMTYGAPRVWRR